MAKKKPARKSTPKKAAPKKPAVDRGEEIFAMEPLRFSEESKWRAGLNELVVDLTFKAASLKSSLPEGMLAALADLVRSMNCYYSNLIEGHDTHPIDIERALNDDLSRDPKKRELQLEAKAHISVQRWIDNGGLRGRETSVDGILETHRRFIEGLPAELRSVSDPKTGTSIPVIPGEFRDRDVKVGRHIAISPGAVPRFLTRYAAAYSTQSRGDKILSAAAAHHRLLWIHPFADGNGRVARLMSHAIFLDALETAGIWSVARGLALKVDRYKNCLAGCDATRRNDLDGRGNLSEEALAEFTRFFLEVSIDQVEFMQSLMQPDRLRARVLSWAEEETRLSGLSKKAGQILEAILYRGELPRADIPGLIQTTDRQALRVVKQLQDFGVLTSLSSRTPWRLALPATLAHRWLPGLFPAS